MIDLTKLVTETRNPNTMELDQMTPLELVSVMNQEDLNVVAGVKEALPQVAQAIEWAVSSLEAGGRIVYFGAGTSGRLGVLDAVECPPTFGVSPDVVVGLIAGGEKAIAIGIAASGRTPYVIGGLRYARFLGCKTVAIACNKGSEVGKEAELAIEPSCGPEVLTGSTRLKAGTAQKMILNMISTGSMVGVGKAYQNLMVDVQQTNKKLVVRAQNITIAATGCTREEAARALEQADGNAKLAIVMLLTQMPVEEAKAKLEAAHGHVRGALQ